MALFFADLVREASWGEGAGNLVLGGALPGHRRFADAVPPGARFHYAICGVTHPDEWETGEGEIASGALVRAPIASSDGGEAVAFSAGLKTVALTANAAWFEGQEAEIGIGDVDGLADALAGKAATGHGHDGTYQPLDADLSAIASLSTTAFGRAQLALADAAALRGHAGLGGMAVQDAGAVAITGGAISGISSLSVGGLGVFAGDYLYRITTNAEFTLYGGSAGGGGAFVRVYGSAHASKANRVEIATAGGTVAALFAGDGAASLAGALTVGGAISVGGSQVVAARRSGWVVPSGTASRTSFDTASVTTEALAERVKALIDDLAAHGLIGS